MRPIKLVVSAFGPYAANTVFELDKLGNKGLYLITGDTGAGKTTIFDAIAYALYGEASGGTRDIGMFRSKYANAETPTFVELEFEYAGKNYFVRRSPDYQRPAKRGDGLTLQKADAELQLPDGNVVTKIREVNSAIKDILGIDRSQFTQIAMIAQGEFLKLILASTEERQKIFREIFGTRSYQILQDKLKTESGELNRSCDTLRSSMKQYVEGAICKPDDVLEFDLEKSKAGLAPIVDTLELIDNIISQDEDEKKQIEANVSKIEAECSEIAALLGKEEETAKTRNVLEETKTFLEEKLLLQKQGFERFEREQEKLPEREKRSAAIVTAKNDLPKYAELESIHTIIAEQQLTLSKTQAQRNQQLEMITTLETTNQAQKDEFEARKNIRVLFSELLQKKEKLSEKEEAVNKIRSDYNDAKSSLLGVQQKLQELTENETKKAKELGADTDTLELNKKERDILSNIHVMSAELKQKEEKLVDAQTVARELKAEISQFAKLRTEKQILQAEQRKKERELSDELITIETTLEKQKIALEGLRDIEIVNHGLLQKNQELVAKKNAIIEIVNAQNNISDLGKNLERAQDELAIAIDNATSTTAVYELKFKAYLSDQAGIIAKTLRGGESCPVCGSKSHPKPAQFSVDAPSKEELDTAKEEAEQVKSSATKASEAAASIKVELTSKIDFLLKRVVPIIGVCEFAGVEDLIKKESVALETLEQNLLKEITASEGKIKEKEGLSTAIQNNETLLKETTTLLNQSRNNLSSITTEIATLEEVKKENILKRATILLGDCSFETIEETLSECMAGFIAQTKSLDLEIKQVNRKVQTFETLKNQIPLLEEKISVLNNELHEIKRSYSTKQVTLNTLMDRIASIHVSLNASMQLEAVACDNNIGTEANEFDRIENKLASSLGELSKSQTELSAELVKTKRQVVRHTELETLIPETDENIKLAGEILAKDNNVIGSTEATIAALVGNTEKIKGTLKHENKVQAEIEIAGFEQELALLTKAFHDAEKENQEITSAVNELEGKKKALEDQLKEGKVVDVAALTEKNIQLNNTKASFNDAITAIAARLDRNNNARSGIKKQFEVLHATEEKYTWVKALSNTANGTISGKEKIMLETYIQMTYFDRIIARANTRFMSMSSGQYELKRRVEAENNRSQSGLELDVIDHYNGTERSVKTLSGGESFKASLSLALGLSDEIQASAGGIKLDTMFVDEGFGSLDDESLKQAINTLASLSEGHRLIGIISHVAELKEKIDKQIVVRKAKSGGSFVEVIG